MPRSSSLVKHKCSQCHRSYAHLHTLIIHEATHRGRYPYWCKVCGKGFLATTNLRGHMAQHTGVAEFNCDICGRQFRYPQHIKKHLEQHSKESSGSVKPKCSQCHRSYAHLHTLRIHEATHRGRYPYWCKVCGKGFLATINLRGPRDRPLT